MARTAPRSLGTVSTIEKLFAIGLGVVTVGLMALAIYVPVTVTHFDAQLASIRSSLESTATRYDAQASRIDTAFTQVGSVAADAAAARVEIGYIKNDVGDIKSAIKQIRDDVQKIKNAVRADAGGWISPTASGYGYFISGTVVVPAGTTIRLLAVWCG